MRFDRLPATKQMLFRAVGTSPDHLSLPLCGTRHNDQKLTGVLAYSSDQGYCACIGCGDSMPQFCARCAFSSFKHAAPNGRADVCPLSALIFWVFEMTCDTAYNDRDASGNIASVRVRALSETEAVGRGQSAASSLEPERRLNNSAVATEHGCGMLQGMPSLCLGSEDVSLMTGQACIGTPRLLECAGCKSEAGFAAASRKPLCRLAR